ncbi:MAG TPA: hypothetical protein VK436_16830 [Methanocella sp.]|nr:hypothetical protein [Methanocella sp.]
MKCCNHSDRDAITTCATCGRPICSICELYIGGKSLCEECAGKSMGSGSAGAPVPSAPHVQSVQPASGASGAPVASSAPAVSFETKIKEPILAALFSFLVFGLGQIYNGQVKKGFSFLMLDILYILFLIFVFFCGNILGALMMFLSFFLSFFGSIFLSFFGMDFIGSILIMIMPILVILACCIGMFCCFPFIFLPILWRIYSIYDAYKVAEEINHGRVVEDWF